MSETGGTLKREKTILKDPKDSSVRGRHKTTDKEIVHLRFQVEQQSQYIETQKREIVNLRQSRDDLFMQLTRFTGLKAQIRSLFVELYIRLNKKIDNIGRFKVAHKPPQFPSSQNDEDLVKAIDSYDSIAFSEKKTIGSSLAKSYGKFLKYLLKVSVFSARYLLRPLKRIKNRLR